MLTLLVTSDLHFRPIGKENMLINSHWILSDDCFGNIIQQGNSNISLRARDRKDGTIQACEAAREDPLGHILFQTTIGNERE